MPVTFREAIINGVRHVIPEFWCEGCGSPAHFGEAVNLKLAMGPNDPHYGRWWCGRHPLSGQGVCNALSAVTTDGAAAPADLLGKATSRRHSGSNQQGRQGDYG